MKTLHYLRFMTGCGLMAVLAVMVFPARVSAQVADPIFSSALGPAVRIVSPPNHAVFFAPADVPILAYTRPEATFTNVEFYANGMDLGHGVRLDLPGGPVSPALASPDIMGSDILLRLHQVWAFVWTNAPAGSYALTAVASGYAATATESLARTSAPVNITIVSTTAPTNLPDVVDIVATDPIAIAGTNFSWTWQGTTNATPSWTNWPLQQWTWFTNWGPKSALFTVHRFGDASSGLIVDYDIGGTASNGVDYFALPGFVSIPAGYNRALIPIVPIDHGTNTGPKTVILTLESVTAVSTSLPLTTNTLPLIGKPNSAEALILENWPRPLPWLLPDGTFHFNASGPDGAWFGVQISANLQNWTTTCTNQIFQGSMDFVDPNAPNSANGFYRTIPITNAPAD